MGITVLNEMLVHNRELAGQHTTSIDVGCVWLNALVVAEDLRGGGSGHGGNL